MCLDGHRTLLILHAFVHLQDTLMVESVVKIVETALKSTHLPTKMSALHGSLYLLETGVTEVTHHLVSLLGDYTLTSLTSITPYDISFSFYSCHVSRQRRSS